MAVGTRPDDVDGLTIPGLETFDMESCFQTAKNECIQAETPIYWTTSYVYVCLLFTALFLNFVIILLYLRGIYEFKKMMFYWLTFQLLASNVVYCIGQLISRDTLVIFLRTSQFDQAFMTGIFQRMHNLSKWISNFYSQILPLGIILLALHRFGIFVLNGSRISESHFMAVVIVLLWLLVVPMTITLTTFDCLYHFKTNQDMLSVTTGVYSFQCGASNKPAQLETWIQKIFEAEQLVIPCLDLLIYVIIIVYLMVTKGLTLSQKASYILLVPPFLLFVVVEVSSILGILLLTSKMEMSYALTARRLISIVDMTATSLIPVIVFATNKEVRQMLSCYTRKRTVQPNLLFISPSQNFIERRKSEFMSHVSGIQQHSPRP